MCTRSQNTQNTKVQSNNKSTGIKNIYLIKIGKYRFQKNINGIQFLHNLLHITGDLTTQPFVDNDIACVYNGEIYNHSEFGSYKSDGECLIDLYKEHGESFVNQLDGEFAICLVDFKNQKVIIAVDTFSCKPLWYEFSDSTFCIGSYNSQLTGLGFKQGQTAPWFLT